VIGGNTTERATFINLMEGYEKVDFELINSSMGRLKKLGWEVNEKNYSLVKV